MSIRKVTISSQQLSSITRSKSQRTFKQTYNNIHSNDKLEKTTNPTTFLSSTSCAKEICPQQNGDVLATTHCKRCKDKSVNYYLTSNNLEKAK